MPASVDAAHLRRGHDRGRWLGAASPRLRGGGRRPGVGARGSREAGATGTGPEAARLFFALISSRYERRSSNKTFSAWADIFVDPVAVAAMVDRLVRHAEVIVLKGDSYRLRGKLEEC